MPISTRSRTTTARRIERISGSEGIAASLPAASRGGSPTADAVAAPGRPPAGSGFEYVQPRLL
ncbi:MAG: hypothetical protein OXU61_07930 [Gammaproteobacteria bacterium]|nr:hypothetical protein [Gammaproteobacteria bacterium]